MRDETVIIRKRAASYAYLFWVSGIRRGDHVALLAEGTTIGRDNECDVILDDDTVSAEQARIRLEDGEWYLYDLASTNRTAVAGADVFRHVLADRERVTFGETDMVFRVLPTGGAVMDFLEWDSTARIAFFGAVFLLALLPGLVVFGFTITRPTVAPWVWRIGLGVLAIAAFPPIVFDASIDPGDKTLFTTLAWIAIGSALLVLFGCAAFFLFGLSEEPMEEWAPPLDDNLSFDTGPATTEVVSVGVGMAFSGMEDATRNIRPAEQPVKADAYFLAKSGRDKGRQFAVANGSPAVIGRSGAEATIVIDDERVSGTHGQVRLVNGNYTYVDMNSTNGSFLLVEGRSEPIRQPQVLVDGDEIRVGHTVLAFVDTRKGARS